MKIDSKKTYEVTKYNYNKETVDCGRLPGSDVKRMLAGYEYDTTYEMWFTPRAMSSYEVVEVED